MATPSNTKTIEAVEKLLKDPPVPLKRLIEKEGLDFPWPQRGSKAAIEKRLKKDGLFDASKQWAESFASSVRICLPNRSIAVGRELAWRYLEQKAELSRDAWLSAVHIEQKAGESDPDAARLPVDIYWVYRHPLMSATLDDASPPLERAGRQYEMANPCPSNGALSRLTSARRDAKSIEAFMRYVDKLLVGPTASRKGGGGPAAVGLVELAEEEAIADLEVQLLQEMEQKMDELAAEGMDDSEEEATDEDFD